jgi:DNA-binding transcriptional LysR family regulator
MFVSSLLPKKFHSWPAARALQLGALSAGTDGQPRYLTRFLKAINISKKISFSSDSLEALAAAASHGSVIAILPVRVARRASPTLIEVTPPELVEKRLGSHSINLVSATSCDPAENDFLAKQVRELLDIDH